MVAHARLSGDLPLEADAVTSLADLSLDQVLFLRSCHERWFDLSGAEAAAIIKAARKLCIELLDGHNAAVGGLTEDSTERKGWHHDR